GEEAPGLAIPMHAGAADPIAGQKTPPFADRQRGLRGIVAHGQRFLLRAQEDIVAHGIAKFIRSGADVEIAGGIAPWATLDRNHVEAGMRQLVSEDRSGPAETDDDDILARKTAGHQRPPQAGRPCILTGGSVEAWFGLSMTSRKS